MGLKLRSGKRDRWGEGVLRSGFISLFILIYLIGEKLNSLFSPGSVSFVRDSDW